jgi:hypothetical protein
MGEPRATETEIVIELPSAEVVGTALEEKARRLREIIQKATQYAETVEVKDDEAEKEALTVSGRMLKAEKALKALKIEFERPFKALIGKTGEIIAPLINDSIKFRQLLNGKMNTYAAFKKAEQQRLEAEMREKQRELQEEINKRTPEGFTPAVVPDIKAPKIPKTTKVDEGYTSFQKEYVSVEIVRPDLVPRKYCEPSKKLCLAAVKAGAKGIAGVKIIREMRTEVRTG